MYLACTNNALTISGGSVNFDGTGLVSPSVINLGSSSGDIACIADVVISTSRFYRIRVLPMNRWF